jgi:hypothetical protein
MSGQHALRKRLGTLMKMAQCEWRYEQEPKWNGRILNYESES